MKTIRETFNAENWVDDKLTLVARVNTDGSFRLNIKEWGGDDPVDSWFVSAPYTEWEYTFQNVYGSREDMERGRDYALATLCFDPGKQLDSFECYTHDLDFTRFGSTPFEAVAKMKAHLG